MQVSPRYGNWETPTRQYLFRVQLTEEYLFIQQIYLFINRTLLLSCQKNVVFYTIKIVLNVCPNFPRRMENILKNHHHLSFSISK